VTGCANHRPIAAVAGAERALAHHPAHGITRPAVAIVSSQTGSVAAIDLPSERGAQLAFERHAARAGAATPAPETRVFDTASTADGAARASMAARAAWGAGSATPVVALGLCDTDLALASVPAFSNAGVPFVVIGATAPDLPKRCGEGTFLACFGDDAQGLAAADFAHARFGTRLVIVFDSRSVYSRTAAGFCRSRFLTQGGTVAMEVRTAGRQVRVAVADEGPGIPIQARERVFDRFWSGSDRGGQSGLGLAIAQAIARRHGGVLRVGESGGDRGSGEGGGGCVLLVELPIADPIS
jgi:hypothetical protein